MMTSNEIKKKLMSCNIDKFCQLWQGASMKQYYGKYEVEGIPDTNAYNACYSTNDGNVSDKMLKAIIDYRTNVDDQTNIWVCDGWYGKEEAFVVYHNGTNGFEGNALSAIRDAADKLEEIQKFTKWATLLDCSCDTSDDVYRWLFTFEVE